MGWTSGGVLRFLLAFGVLLLVDCGATPYTKIDTKFYDVHPDYLCQVWSDWSVCSRSCAGGTESRRRLCKWKDFSDNAQQMFYQTRTSSCNNFPCPAWGDWVDWSECTVTCGGGVSKRDRICNNMKEGTPNCDGPVMESKVCSVELCPYWSEWSDWATCSASCSGGMQDRLRECHRQEGGELNCVGGMYEKRKCAEFFCPYWSEWSEWSACDVTCGNGTRQMTRTCIKDPKGNAFCSGKGKIVEECHLLTCATWEEWSPWTSCPVTCGNGTITRERRCSNEDGSIGTCPGSAMEVAKCQKEACPRWSDWTAWADCSARCGGGVQDRARQCITALNSDFRCDGDDREIVPCAMFNCPFWGEWSDWADCSTSCGQGVETKSRPCNSAEGSGLSCDGSAKMTRSCKRPECPYWHPWSDWTRCDATCGGGKKHRERTCKEMNGFQCDGESSEVMVCAPYPCPVWANWSDWSTCDATCDGGTMRKTRKCLADPKSGFRCKGLNEDVKACGQVLCRDCTPELLNCDFSENACSFTTASRSPLAFFFRRNTRGFLEIYAPFAKQGDWAELQSVVFKGCMAGQYCLTVHQAYGSTKNRLSKNLIVVRSATRGEVVAWQRPQEPNKNDKEIKVDIELAPADQVVFKVTKDTDAFEYLWMYRISATRGRC